MTEVPAYGSPEADEVDWFGDGSAFDSGEDLASALFGMAGIREPSRSLSVDDNDEALDDPFEWGPRGVSGTAAPPPALPPAPRPAPWPVLGREGTAPSQPTSQARPAWSPDASPAPPGAWPKAMPFPAGSAAVGARSVPDAPVQSPTQASAAAPAPSASPSPAPAPSAVPAPQTVPSPQTTPQVPVPIRAPVEPPTWGLRGQGVPEPHGSSGGAYGIRHGVRALRMAEEAMDKLRVDAVEVAWAAAAVAAGQRSAAGRPRK